MRGTRTRGITPKNAHLWIPLFLLLASARGAAQVSETHGEVFAAAGVSQVGGDEGSLGNGLYLLGGVGLRVATSLSVELDLMRARHERVIAGGLLEGTSTGVLGNVAYHFSEGRMQIFVMGSAGVLRSESSHTFPSGGTSTPFRSDESHFAWGGGGGVKVFLTPRLSLRPGFRLLFSEATGVMGLAAASVGVGYHW